MASVEDIQKLREELAQLKVENENIKRQQRLKNQTVLFYENDKNQIVVQLGKYECKLFKDQWKNIIENIEQLKALL